MNSPAKVIVAKPVKLSDGTWGAFVPTQVQYADVIRVKTASGKSWDATVAEVIQSGPRGCIVATRAMAPAPVVSARVAVMSRRVQPTVGANFCHDCGGPCRGGYDCAM